MKTGFRALGALLVGVMIVSSGIAGAGTRTDPEIVNDCHNPEYVTNRLPEFAVCGAWFSTVTDAAAVTGLRTQVAFAGDVSARPPILSMAASWRTGDCTVGWSYWDESGGAAAQLQTWTRCGADGIEQTQELDPALVQFRGDTATVEVTPDMYLVPDLIVDGAVVAAPRLRVGLRADAIPGSPHDLHVGVTQEWLYLGPGRDYTIDAEETHS